MIERRNIKVLMLGASHKYPSDTRLRQEAQTLLHDGYDVTVLVTKRPAEKVLEIVDGVRVIRLPRVSLFGEAKRKDRWNFLDVITRIMSHAVEHGYITATSFLVSSLVSVFRGVDIIHIHNPPDTFWIWGPLFKLFGKKFAFDHHDLSPELYLSRYGMPKNNDLFYNMLLWSERLSCKAADAVIATNESYKQLDVERNGVRPQNVFVVRNGPDLRRARLVEKDPELVGMNKKLLGYIGAMNPQDGLDYLLRALWHLVHEFKRQDFYCVLIGPGDSLNDLINMSHELELGKYVRFTGFIPDEQVFRYLSSVDICVDPDPSSPLNDRSTWIKIMEFMALGEPIVCFDLKETRVTAQHSAIYVPPNDVREFAKAIIRLLDDPELGRKMGQYGRWRVENELEWNHVKHNLLRAYQHLNSRPPRLSEQAGLSK